MFDRLLTVQDLSERLGLSHKTIHQLVRDRKLSCVQVTPRERRFLLEQVTEFIESRIIAVPESTIDRKTPNSLLSPAKSMKGGNQSVGEVRAQLREEMREW